MKKIIFGLAITATTLASCNNNSKSAENQNKIDDTQSILQTDNAATTSSALKAMNTVTISAVVNEYLQIKNGLATDNGKDAANAGKGFVEAIGKVDNRLLSTEQQKIWKDISADAKEMAEHIAENPDKLEHQREHFVMLSKDMYDLVKEFGSGQVLYKVFDSMSNEGKGAFWLSETKEIKNPYMGKAMLDSGTIQEEIK